MFVSSFVTARGPGLPALPRVLLAFERSGRVRRAFALRGWFAVSCDLEPTALPCGPNEAHHRGDAFEVIESGEHFDMLIAFPECRYLARSGLHWNSRDLARRIKTENALVAVRRLLAAPIGKIALENPTGRIGTAVRPPDQIIQPHQFGDDASKATCLWLKNLPPLRATKSTLPREGRIGKRRWSNQTDSGQNNLPGSMRNRAAVRALTYQGIADAMADQWGDPALTYAPPSQLAFDAVR